MKFKSIIALSTILFLGWSVIYAHAGKPTVAVFDFEIGTTETKRLKVTKNKVVNSTETQTSRQTNLLTNKLITELATSRAVIVVERDKVAAIMVEINLSEAELTDPKNRIRIGKLLGADYLIFGSITMLDPSVRFKQLPYNAGTQKIMSLVIGSTIRMVKTETGQIEAAADLQAEKRMVKNETTPVGINKKQIQINSDVGKDLPQKFQDEVYSDLARKLASKIVNTLNPIKVANFSGDTVYLARGALPKGNRYEVVKLGEEIRDPDTNELLGQTEDRIAIIQVTAGLKSMSKAEVSEWIVEDKIIPKGSICRPIQ